MTKYLTDYHSPDPENLQDLEQLELLFKKIEILVRERQPQNTITRQHVLMRLMEAQLLAKELVKGTFEDE